MDKFRKKFVALGVSMAVLVSSVVSTSAFAWVDYPWPGAHTPYTGEFYASVTEVCVQNISWSSAQTESFSTATKRYGVEFEFRPKGYIKDDVWAECLGEASNMPSAYFEFQESDPDDIAVCCADLRRVRAENVYYARMTLKKNINFTEYFLPYTFESEYGEWIPIASDAWGDYWPIGSATYNNGTYNVEFNRIYRW